MSNTSSVTPYVTAPVVAAAATTMGVVLLGRWLFEENDDDRTRRKERRRASCRQTLDRSVAASSENQTAPKISHRPQLTSVALHARNMDSILHAAARLGYRVEAPRAAVPTVGVPNRSIRLRRGTERLGVVVDESGAISLHTAGSAQRIQLLMQRHSLDRALAHAGKQDMDLQTQRLANGEIEIGVRERSSRHPDGQAALRARIRKDGVTCLDVDGIAGTRCREITEAFAEAIGGVVSDTHYKDAFYVLPGEPTRVDTRAGG